MSGAVPSVVLKLDLTALREHLVDALKEVDAKPGDFWRMRDKLTYALRMVNEAKDRHRDDKEKPDTSPFSFLDDLMSADDRAVVLTATSVVDDLLLQVLEHVQDDVPARFGDRIADFGKTARAGDMLTEGLSILRDLRVPNAHSHPALSIDRMLGDLRGLMSRMNGPVIDPSKLEAGQSEAGLLFQFLVLQIVVKFTWVLRQGGPDAVGSIELPVFDEVK